MQVISAKHATAVARGVVVAASLALAVGLAPVGPVGADPAPEEGGDWGQHVADERNSRQAGVAGPDDPGVKWFTDLGEVETGFAPEGYNAGHGMGGRAVAGGWAQRGAGAAGGEQGSPVRAR